MAFDFDQPVNKRGTGNAKWDAMGTLLKGGTDHGLAMWIAQMDFALPPFLVECAEQVLANGDWGYFVNGEARLFAATAAWIERRHGWRPDPDHCLFTHGLGNAIGLCIQALSDPGDGVIVFTPVYHEFALKVARNGRRLVEAPLARDGARRFQLDLGALEARLTGRERLVLMSSPHNPAGRLWSAEELRELAAFCERHGLILISDEIHQDLVMPGHTHIPTMVAAPEAAERVVVMTAASKTFDIAGLRTGVMTVPGDAVRAKLTALHKGLDIQPTRLGVEMTDAAYSDAGDVWVEQLCRYLDGNRALLAAGVEEIPGVTMAPHEATYLAWLDFSGTGLGQEEVDARLFEQARIAATHGLGLGEGSACCHRLNFGTRRAHVAEAVRRLKSAFAAV